jgi:uncharacterized protein
MSARAILFTRYPVPGAVKSRLIPALGADGAARLHRRLTERMAGRMREIARPGVEREVRYTGGTREAMEQWLGAGFAYRAQCDGDLGDRLRDAFHEAFDSGCERVVAIGSDAPGLTAAIIQSAFERLTSRAVVIGPSVDGGYYLIGMSRFIPEVFEGISWGSERVCEETLRSVTSLSLEAELLAPLADVDRPEDLPLVQDLLAS